MNKLKYLLSNSGKFHHFELAKVLYKRNQLTKIICGYPWFKLKYEKIPKSFVESHGIFNTVRYFVGDNNKLKSFTDYLDILNKKNIDRITCKYTDNDDVDVLIALSSVGLNAGKKISKNNKIYICERSSSHIIFQEKILAEEYKEFNQPKFIINKWFIDRDLEEYEEADIILVPSLFVKKSFEKFNINKKVKVLQFGSNLENFFPISSIKKDNKFFDILFIGAHSFRKGLHYLIDAFHQFKHPYKRLHIVGGSTVDKNFFRNKIKHEKIIVYGHVNQLKLNDIINRSHVFILPSLEEGMAIVTLQAIASGCPVIVSENTGAAELVNENKCGFVVPIRNSKAIADKLTLLMDNKNLLNEFSHNAHKIATKNTWDHYVNKLDQLIVSFKENK